MEQRVNPLHTNHSKQARANGQNVVRQRLANQRNATSNPGRTVGTTSNYGISRSPSALRVGDILRGEITDLRNNEISITLENNTVVHGHIPDSATYAIGQARAFRLVDISNGTLYLENISKGYSDTELTLINKALEEANLPSTEHNQITVKALMDNLLPINRDSIQMLMQQAYDYHTNDMNTLAVMNRLMLEINEDSIHQFSNYRNDNYQLLERLQNFSKDIPSLLSALAHNSQSNAVANFGKSLLSIGLSSSTASTSQATISSLPAAMQSELISLLSNTPLTDDLMQQLENRTLPLHDALTLIRDAANSGTLKLPEGANIARLTNQLNQINGILEPNFGNTPVITEDSVKNIIKLNDAVSAVSTDEIAEQSINAIEENSENATTDKTGNRLAFAGKFIQTLSKNAKNTLVDRINTLRTPIETETSLQKFEPNALDTLIQEYETHSRNNDLLSSYLSAQERDELNTLLQKLPISPSLFMKITDGDATTKEVLTVIYNTISLADSEQISTLFQSDAFEKLFARELQSAWTMTPEQLQKENPSDFYTKMHSQLQQFRELIQTTLSGDDSSQLSNFARDIEQNILFMKTLNETFSYFQLPLKLPSQDAHGDLYVYTKKERMQQNSDKTSVLLHLDMENLGKIDIKLDKNMQDIKADFSLDDTDSVRLLEINSDMLKDALSRQGYQCMIKVQQKEQPSLSVDDFINTKVNTHATNEMKRFSFDIRA